jgi:FkbM family methyltransferase
MFCLSKTAFARSHKILSKEPETIAWLDGIEPASVLWDVGANVGGFTLYAAIKRRARVVAFEPAAANFLTLNRNIELNDLHDRVTAFCIAVAPKTGINVLYMPSTDFGASLCNYGTPTDFQGNPFQPTFEQGAVGFTLDDLVAWLPFPSHLKIDVDGLERDIIRAGDAMLSDQRLRSAAIELDRARPQLVLEVVDTMRRHGFKHLNEGAEPRSQVVMNAIFAR